MLPDTMDYHEDTFEMYVKAKLQRHIKRRKEKDERKDEKSLHTKPEKVFSATIVNFHFQPFREDFSSNVSSKVCKTSSLFAIEKPLNSEFFLLFFFLLPYLLFRPTQPKSWKKSRKTFYYFFKSLSEIFL